MLQGDRLLTVKAAAMVLGVRPARLYDLVARRIIPVVRIGRQIRLAPAALREFIDRGGAPLDRGGHHGDGQQGAA